MKKIDLIKLLAPYRDDQEIAVRANEDGWWTGDIKVTGELLYGYCFKHYGMQYRSSSHPGDLVPAINVVCLQ